MTKFNRIDDVPSGVDIKDVFKMMENRIDTLESYIVFDKELRRRHPALQELYEKYQITKTLLTDKE